VLLTTLPGRDREGGGRAVSSHDNTKRRRNTVNIKRITAATAVAAVAAVGFAATASAADEPLHFQKGAKNAPGQQDRIDEDNNGISDAGVYVTGHYKSLYAEDASGAYYWDLGDGRIQKSSGITGVGDLDSETVVTCDYQVTYRADYGNDPYMNSGWITNNIQCDDGSATQYLIVHQSDQRFTNNEDNFVWTKLNADGSIARNEDGTPVNTWEYHVLAQSGEGNLAKHSPVLVG
jgi:hypothetical protein